MTVITEEDIEMHKECRMAYVKAANILKVKLNAISQDMGMRGYLISPDNVNHILHKSQYHGFSPRQVRLVWKYFKEIGWIRKSLIS